MELTKNETNYIKLGGTLPPSMGKKVFLEGLDAGGPAWNVYINNEAVETLPYPQNGATALIIVKDGNIQTQEGNEYLLEIAKKYI